MDLLCKQGSVKAAIQVEELGNQLTQRFDVAILCGYSLGTLKAGWTVRSSNESVHSIPPFIACEKRCPTGHFMYTNAH